ncbi:sensor histidine kinase [Patulibacter americanus]|uniref:sensor histidine kinase n=1 Tax=Patulibacter americanus TaxID=588672 RepID=UPI0003B61C56|nr:sensor histidine kinase [Patulibacter americanus]
MSTPRPPAADADPTRDLPARGDEPTREQPAPADEPTREQQPASDDATREGPLGGAPPAAGPAPARRRFDPRRLAVQAGTDFGLLVAGFALGTAFFTIAVTLVSVSLGLLVLVVGVPIAAGSALVLQGCAELDRRRLGLATDRPLVAVYRPLQGTLVARTLGTLRDPRRWFDALYLVVQFPLTLAGFIATVTGWAVALYCLVYPAVYAVLPADWDGGLNIGDWTPDTFLESLLVVPLGVVAVPLAWGISRLAMVAQVELGRLLLTDERAKLNARVSRLEETRAGVVDASSAELRRIERDLHDGAQARMVAVAMDLGMAEERMEEDPEAARRLVSGARVEARRALAEMRDLVRGVAPSVLADRGLDAALASLAGRSRVPVTLDVDLGERPPASVETAAYFVVAEALTNAAKHADATTVTVVVLRHGDELLVRVTDDGGGGATARPGGGLAGLRDRVAALDGTLTITSPDGGPTTVAARFPCAS